MNANPYLMLGVRPFINRCSVRTMHGGSLMLPQIRDVMAEASRHFVNLDELMEAAGRRLAELTGAEWGIVTCGSAAAVALGTAACVAGNDPVKMLRLPFTDGMVNRVIIPRTQRFAYDQAVRMIGCPLVEVDTRQWWRFDRERLRRRIPLARHITFRHASLLDAEDGFSCLTIQDEHVAGLSNRRERRDRFAVLLDVD